jgi:hypothetical protein
MKEEILLAHVFEIHKQCIHNLKNLMRRSLLLCIRRLGKARDRRIVLSRALLRHKGLWMLVLLLMVVLMLVLMLVLVLMLWGLLE